MAALSMPMMDFSITETHVQKFLCLIIRKCLMLHILAQWVSFFEFQNRIVKISAGLIPASVLDYYCISEASVDFVPS